MPDDEIEVDPAIAAALAEDDEDEDLVIETTPEMQAATEEVKAELRQEIRAAGGKAKRGRPRKEEVAARVQPISREDIAKKGPPDTNPRRVWEKTLRFCQEKGLGGPEAISIHVKRYRLGAERTVPEDLQSIPGDAVAGNEAKGPGDDLYDYIVRAYHVAIGCGPSMYRCGFYLRAVQRGNYLGMAEFKLPAAAEIKAQWAAMAVAQRDQELTAQLQRPPANAGRSFAGTAANPPNAAVLPTAALPPMPMPPASDDRFAQWQFMFQMYERMAQQAIQLGQVPPPMPPMPAPPAAGPSKEELASVVAKTVVETLTAMGIKPAAPPAERPLDSPTVQQTVVSPQQAAREFFMTMREFKKIWTDMEDEFRPEPEATPAVQTGPTVIVPPEEQDETELHPVNAELVKFGGAPVMYAKQKPNEGTLAYLARLGMGNPGMAQALLEKGARMLDQGNLGKLINAFTQMGGPQAAAASRFPQGQVVEAPQANGQAVGWKPDVG